MYSTNGAVLANKILLPVSSVQDIRTDRGEISFLHVKPQV